MPEGNASAKAMPPAYFLLRQLLPRSLTNYPGRRLFRLLLTVRGLKRHWLFRSAFRSKQTNAPPPLRRPLVAPKEKGE